MSLLDVTCTRSSLQVLCRTSKESSNVLFGKEAASLYVRISDSTAHGMTDSCWRRVDTVVLENNALPPRAPVPYSRCQTTPMKLGTSWIFLDKAGQSGDFVRCKEKLTSSL